MTVEIQPEAPVGAKPYEHLKPIVQALLVAGNEISKAHGSIPADDLGFYMNRDGWVCALRDPINFSLVANEFVLPPSIKLNEKKDSIFCERSWIEIRGNLG